MANAILKYYSNRDMIIDHSTNNLKLAKDITIKTKACIDVLFKNNKRKM